MGDSGDEWEFQRIGTQAEKQSVEKELKELRERVAHVEEWQKRKQVIEEELNRVWVDGGEELAPPAYVEKEVEPSAEGTERTKGAEEAEDVQSSLAVEV